MRLAERKQATGAPFVPYGLILLVPAALVPGLVLGGAWTFAPVILVYGLLPVLDWMLGADARNPVPGDKGTGTTQAGPPGVHRWLLWAWVPLQIALMVWALMVFAGEATWVERIGITLSCALVTGGTSIVIAHELAHSPRAFERALAEYLMTTASYTHFCIEHVRGHHRLVGTPDDPATARFGESYYTFWARSVPGQVKSAWRLEAGRLQRRGKSPLSARNRMLRYGLELVLLYGVVWIAFGPLGPMFMAGQSLLAISFLEAVNYLEHYGLMRRFDPATSRYERVQPHHSWNTSSQVTNWLTINLGRHSDHHYQAARPYQALRTGEDLPTLPQGYPLMIMAAFVPPVWHRVMDARVRRWRAMTGNPIPPSGRSEAAAA